MKLIEYIEHRIARKDWHNATTPIHDLITDMNCDIENLRKCENGNAIYHHILSHGCKECGMALESFIDSYKAYCRRKGLESEKIRANER